MTRLRTLVLRALVVALLLLTLGGGVASADPGTFGVGLNALPDDPGYDPGSLLLPDDPGYTP